MTAGELKDYCNGQVRHVLSNFMALAYRFAGFQQPDLY